MKVLENTSTVHNLVVCTLCSCYPWPVLGLPPVWYKSAPYRSRSVSDPRGVLKEFGTEAAFWQGSAYRNELPSRVELGGQGATEADLAPDELRKRMWWGKALANFRESFKAFNQYEYLRGLPDNLQGLGEWAELPEHLK